MYARGLINRYFNVGRFIITIQEANMNLDVLQYKKYWKWDHATHSCRVQGSKCIKCNGLHLTEHHWQFFWYCKANSKTNPSRLETKQRKLCPHSFRYQNWRQWTLNYFHFLFNLSFFLFLELGLGWPDHVIIYQSHQMT